jgi:very-short-patch-repair endonuclease
VDGRLHGTDSNQLELDRNRQNALVLAGWRVLRFTWPMVRGQPDAVIATIRRALKP